MQREDPELYNTMEDRYNSLTNSGSSYSYDADDFGYGDPLPGESFSDYVKREDPDLYNDMQSNFDSWGW